MKSTPAEIEAALVTWRWTTASRNKDRLKVYVNAIMGATSEDASDEQVRWYRLRSLATLLECNLDLHEFASDHITTPGEFWERFDELAPKYRLDGISGADLTPEERTVKSDKEFAALDQVLKERAPDATVQENITVPEDFRILARHVLGIRGPHLPKDQNEQAMNFWASGPSVPPPPRILVPSEMQLCLTELNNLGLETVLGWSSGISVNGSFVCVYSRDEGGEWAWRFVWADEGDTNIFDTVPELFEWLLDYMDDELPDLDGMTNGQILGGQWGGV